MAITKPDHWFNKNVYYLGELCPNLHKWGTCNFSLKNSKTEECTACKSDKRNVTKPCTENRKPIKEEPTSKLDLFYRQIDKSKDCWEWTGSKSKAGYGLFSYNKIKLSHRISYYLTYGEFDKKLFVCHKCDNPSCVNPEHLFLGTAKDNFEDMISKGRNKISALMIANKKEA